MDEEEEEEEVTAFGGLFLGCCGRKNQSSVFMGFVHDLGWSGATISLHRGPPPSLPYPFGLKMASSTAAAYRSSPYFYQVRSAS